MSPEFDIKFLLLQAPGRAPGLGALYFVVQSNTELKSLDQSEAFAVNRFEM